MNCFRWCRLTATLTVAVGAHVACAAEWTPTMNVFEEPRQAAALLLRYFEQMCEPKPFEIRTGDDFRAHQKQLREQLLRCAGLWPLPERVPLDEHVSEPLDHEWCTVQRVYYQLWPGVYGDGLLFMPKELPERPAPGMLCPHGHWPDGNAHPEVQKRCLVLAKRGYVVFSPTQNHYEDPALGISHQTLMIWNNMRALDYLQSLPEVDGDRLGCNGCSGGGLQTQMLVAADDRVKAATIVGMTCDYREIVFAGRNHCGCNHFPSIMRYTDEPELSALGLPTPVQYLTMNDWTKSFEANNLPTIKRLYEANGVGDRVDCQYWPTGHSYDQPKRERMYWWMDKWLRGKDHGGPVPEPEVEPFPVEEIKELKATVPGNKGPRHLSTLYAAQWASDRGNMVTALRELLGRPLPSDGQTTSVVAADEHECLRIERVLCPSEGPISVPTVVLRPADEIGRLPVVVVANDEGNANELKRTDAGSPSALAREGALIVLPDVRFTGELSLKCIAGLTDELLTIKACSPLGEGEPKSFDGVWERNAMLWGRAVPGMAATDIRAVLDYALSRPDADTNRVSLVGSGKVAVASLFAAALDRRVTSVDLDFGGRCFTKRNLPVVPFVLRYGDILQWAALLADREVVLRDVPPEAGDAAWLQRMFDAAGNAKGLQISEP